MPWKHPSNFHNTQIQTHRYRHMDTHMRPSLIHYFSKSAAALLSCGMEYVLSVLLPSYPLQQALVSHILRGHMRLEVNLLTLCPCNNISVASASEQIKIALTRAFVGLSIPFLIK